MDDHLSASPPSYMFDAELRELELPPYKLLEGEHRTGTLPQASEACAVATKQSTTFGHLPAELLQFIVLTACARDVKDPDLSLMRESQNTVWRCTRVSRIWRSVVFDSAELCSILIDFQRFSVSRLRRLLEMSYPLPFIVGHRSSPVEIVIPSLKRHSEGYGREARGMIDLLLVNQARIRELHVYWQFERFTLEDDNFTDLCFSPMPLLKSLTWRGRSTFDSKPVSMLRSISTMVGESYRLPVSRYPSIRRLNTNESIHITLSRLPHDLASSLGTLTELRCSRPRGGGIAGSTRLATLVQIQDFLRAAPNLRFLALQNAILHTSALPAPTTPSIILPHLILVSIGGDTDSDIEDLFHLFAAITPHRRCGLHVSLVEPSTTMDTTPAWAQRIKDMFTLASTEPQPVSTLHLQVDENCEYTIGNIPHPKTALEWWHSDADTLYNQLVAAATPVFSVFSPRLREEAYWAPLALFLPIVENITAFAFSITQAGHSEGFPADEVTARLLDIVYFLATGAETVTFNHTAATVGLTVLNARLESYLKGGPRGDTAYNIDLQKLQILILSSCDFVDDPDLFHMLNRYLDNRTRAGWPVDQVILRRCRVDSKAYFAPDSSVSFEDCDERAATYQQFCRRT